MAFHKAGHLGVGWASFLKDFAFEGPETTKQETNASGHAANGFWTSAVAVRKSAVVANTTTQMCMPQRLAKSANALDNLPYIVALPFHAVDRTWEAALALSVGAINVAFYPFRSTRRAIRKTLKLT